MNGFNRFVMLVVALLMIVVPVLLLLIVFSVIPASTINQYTGYQSGVQALGGLSLSGASTLVRVIILVASIVVALVALILLLRELTFGRRVEKSVTIQDDPGRETRLTSKAVKSLAEGAAREAGAASPSASLASEKKAYRVFCDIKVPDSGNYTEVASRTKENIRTTLENQDVSVRDVEVTVKGNAT